MLCSTVVFGFAHELLREGSLEPWEQCGCSLGIGSRGGSEGQECGWGRVGLGLALGSVPLSFEAVVGMVVMG